MSGKFGSAVSVAGTATVIAPAFTNIDLAAVNINLFNDSDSTAAIVTVYVTTNTASPARADKICKLSLAANESVEISGRALSNGEAVVMIADTNNVVGRADGSARAVV